MKLKLVYIEVVIVGFLSIGLSNCSKDNGNKETSQTPSGDANEGKSENLEVDYRIETLTSGPFLNREAFTLKSPVTIPADGLKFETDFYSGKFPEFGNSTLFAHMLQGDWLEKTKESSQCEELEIYTLSEEFKPNGGTLTYVADVAYRCKKNSEYLEEMSQAHHTDYIQHRVYFSIDCGDELDFSKSADAITSSRWFRINHLAYCTKSKYTEHYQQKLRSQSGMIDSDGSVIEMDIELESKVLFAKENGDPCEIEKDETSQRIIGDCVQSKFNTTFVLDEELAKDISSADKELNFIGEKLVVHKMSDLVFEVDPENSFKGSYASGQLSIEANDWSANYNFSSDDSKTLKFENDKSETAIIEF